MPQSYRASVLNPHWTELGHRNAVMAGRHAPGQGGSHVRDFDGPLSLKTVIGGHAVWTTGRSVHRLNEGFCLILNRGQTYDLDMASDEPVETFCPFFADGFVEGVAAARAQTAPQALDDPGADPHPVEFPQAGGPVADLAAAIAPLRAQLAAVSIDPVAWEQSFHDLAAALLAARPDLRFGLAPSAVRASAREEITRRLARARDYVHAHAEDPIGLKDMAAAAALSPHHFHRLFRQAFGATPAAYLQALRLDRAERLLARTAMPVTEVCFAVGFESLGSFSRLFRKARGAAPSRWREIARSEKRGPAPAA